MDVTTRVRIRRLLPYAAGAVALLVLVLALLPSPGPRSLSDRTEDVSARLRCPTCVAESVADSTSPVAQSMRSEIRRQLADGRSEDQVVAWFRSRYGSSIVLDPQRHGGGWILWLAPPIAGVAVVVAGLLVVRRQRGRADEQSASPPDEPSALPVRRLAVVLVVAVGAAVGVPVLVLGGGSDDAAATRSSPTSTASPTASAASSADPVRRAFELVRAGHPAAAEKVARTVIRRPGRDRPLALLVLGLAQRAEGKAAATRTLRSFVTRYPQHPAASAVRRLLDD